MEVRITGRIERGSLGGEKALRIELERESRSSSSVHPEPWSSAAAVSITCARHYWFERARDEAEDTKRQRRTDEANNSASGF